MVTCKLPTVKETDRATETLRSPFIRTLIQARSFIVANSVNLELPQEMAMETTQTATETEMEMAMVTLSSVLEEMV